MGNRETILAAAVMLAALSGTSPAEPTGQYVLPIGIEAEVSRYNNCEKLEPGKWECTTCVESQTLQQSICTSEITSNPSPSNP